MECRPRSLSKIPTIALTSNLLFWGTENSINVIDFTTEKTISNVVIKFRGSRIQKWRVYEYEKSYHLLLYTRSLIEYYQLTKQGYKLDMQNPTNSSKIIDILPREFSNTHIEEIFFCSKGNDSDTLRLRLLTKTVMKNHPVRYQIGSSTVKDMSSISWKDLEVNDQDSDFHLLDIFQDTG